MHYSLSQVVSLMEMLLVQYAYIGSYGLSQLFIFRVVHLCPPHIHIFILYLKLTDKTNLIECLYVIDTFALFECIWPTPLTKYKILK